VIALVLLPERDCAACTDRQQRAWGCHAVQNEDGDWENAAEDPIELDGETAFRCPRRPIKDDPRGWHQLLTYRRMMNKGFLPEAGGLHDQPVRLMSMLSLVDATFEEAFEEKREQSRQNRR